MSETSVKARFGVDGNAAAVALCGDRDEHLRLIEEAFDVRILARGTDLTVVGRDPEVKKALQVLGDLQGMWQRRPFVGPQDVQRAVALAKEGDSVRLSDLQDDIVQVTSRGKHITPKTAGQKAYVDAMRRHSVVFGIGPAGTGKTYLAMAMAVAALKAKEVDRLILTRPAVEAGEKLGFLPGDLQEKVDPYLRPLYDALYDILGPDIYQRYLERGVIEVAPLAYMRGRTLDNAFIILDEAQNTTPEQMKMFLTRLGFGSKMVITGDITQVDLPEGKESGLGQVRHIVADVEGIAVVYLGRQDVVRHELVQRIIAAYEAFDQAALRRGSAESGADPAAGMQVDASEANADATEEVGLMTKRGAEQSAWPPAHAS